MSTAPKVFSEECSVAVFYGIHADARESEVYYHTAVKWFNDLGYPPDKGGIKGTGHSGKLGSFSRCDSKLQQTGFDGVEYWELLSSTPDAITRNDFLLAADWSPKYSYASIAARSSIVPLDRSAMLPCAQKIIQDMKPAYGIGYKRDHRLGPLLYAIGICQGLGPDGYGVGLSEAEQEEADSISRWGDGMTARVWQNGILRDVYPWNFLTNPHLTKQVGGIPLEQWVRQDARRGTLRTRA